MPAQTILLDFSVDPASFSSLGAQQTLSGNVQSALSEFLPGLQQIHFNEIDRGFLCICTASRSLVVTVRGFPQGLLTINIEYFKDEEAPPILSYELTGKLEGVLSAKLGSKRSQRLPAIKRGGMPQYFITSDERLLEYDIDNVVFEEKSPYQKVQIVHSRSLGNMLLLDDLQNISESDMIYTETLMQRGKEDYRNKEICILGGGDGALLWELLKEEPKFVTMLELDDVVMKACSKHMRSLCGTCLDQMSGPNYEIIVDDCVKVLDRFVASGRKFDYVFGDLTDVPISPTPQGELWDFIRHILNTSLKVIKPGGKYMTHANGASSPASLKMLEDQLNKLEKPVAFTQDRAFVPSFLEEWVFYQVTPKSV